MSSLEAALWVCTFFLCFLVVLECLYCGWKREEVLIRKHLFLRALKKNRLNLGTQTEGQGYVFPPPSMYSHLYPEV